MKRSNRILALSSLALTLAFATGCIAATGDEDLAQNAQEAQALSTDPCSSGALTVDVIPLDDGRFRFVSSAAVGQSAGAVWLKLRNFETLIQIALPGIASDFQWVDGGSPRRVPSRFQFVVDGVTLLEEIFYRSHEDRTLKYRLVTPAIGIESYVGKLMLDECDECGEGDEDDEGDEGDIRRTVITFRRDIRLTDPALVDSFRDLVRLELVNMQMYFAESPN